jgi:nitrite reductase/ring-hydroxylating ferredoxin subunit
MKSNERVIAQANYLAPGQMKAVQVEDTKILLARLTNGDFRAVGAACPHAGAALEQGCCAKSELCALGINQFLISGLANSSNRPPWMICHNTRSNCEVATWLFCSERKKYKDTDKRDP